MGNAENNTRRRGRPQTKLPPPVTANPRSRKHTLPGGVWIESTEAPIEALAYLDLVPPGFAKVKTGDGVEIVALNADANPILKMATTGRRRLTKTQIDAGYRLMADFMVAHASTSNTAAIIAFMQSAVSVSPQDRADQDNALRLGTGYGTMRNGAESKSPKDYSAMKLDAALRVNRIRQRMSRVGWAFAEALCRHEMTPEKIAVALDEPVQYCDVRAREALSELASAYCALDYEMGAGA